MAQQTITHNSYAELDSIGSRIPTYPNVNQSDGKQSQPSQVSLPPWFDKARFDASRSILGEYFMSIFLCHLSGLVLLVFIKSIYTTLSLTGKSKDLVSIFFRYFHTIIHVKLWYEGSVYDPKDGAYHSLLRVKQMHQSVSNIQNKNKNTNEDELALSQRDMVLTQFAFVGLIILRPEQMGFSQKEENLDRLIYFWRCIGYMLGIEDKYNLCNGDYQTVRQNCQQIFDCKFRSRLEEMGKEATVMSEQIVVTANHYIVLLRYRGLIKYLFEVTEVDANIQLNRSEYLFYVALKWIVGSLAHMKLIALFFNNLLRFAFYRLSFKTNVRYIVKSLEKEDNHKMK